MVPLAATGRRVPSLEETDRRLLLPVPLSCSAGKVPHTADLPPALHWVAGPRAVQRAARDQVGCSPAAAALMAPLTCKLGSCGGSGRCTPHMHRSPQHPPSSCCHRSQGVPAAPAAALAGAPAAGARFLCRPVRQPVSRCACCAVHAVLCMLCCACCAVHAVLDMLCHIREPYCWSVNPGSIPITHLLAPFNPQLVAGAGRQPAACGVCHLPAAGGTLGLHSLLLRLPGMTPLCARNRVERGGALPQALGGRRWPWPRPPVPARQQCSLAPR